MSYVGTIGQAGGELLLIAGSMPQPFRIPLHDLGYTYQAPVLCVVHTELLTLPRQPEACLPAALQALVLAAIQILLDRPVTHVFHAAV